MEEDRVTLLDRTLAKQGIMPALAIGILIVLAVFMHTLPLLLYGRFIDENTMTALLAIRQAIPIGHPVPDYLSGTPSLYAEQGIVWLALIAYEIIGKYVGLFATLYGIKILFTVIAGLVVYKFAEKISDRRAGLFAVALYAISQVGMYNEAINLWKGEEFTIIALMSGLLLLVYTIDAFRSKKIAQLVLFSSLFFITILFAVLVWNGGYYAVAALIFAFFAIGVHIFLKDKKISLFVIALPVFALFAAQLLLPAVISPYVLQAFGGAQQPFSYIQNAVFMAGQLQTNSFANQSAWTSNPLFYVQIVCGAILYLGMALYAIRRFELHESNKFAATAFIVLYAAFVFGMPFALSLQFWDVLVYLPISIFAGIGSAHVWESRGTAGKGVYLFVVAAYAILSIAQLAFFTGTIGVITYPYLYSVFWIANNTPSNSVFLTYGSYGTPIEYYANRTSLFDTNIADSSDTTTGFFSFLLQPMGNFSYLAGLAPGPDYMLIDQRWRVQGANVSQYNTSGINLALFESAPYSIIAGNISLSLIYNRYSILIYKIGYNASGFGPGKLAVCRSILCSSA